jgi:cytochrome c oxidase subunit 4
MSDDKPEAEKPEAEASTAEAKAKSEPPAAAKSEPPKAAAKSEPPAAAKSEPPAAAKSEPPKAAAKSEPPKAAAAAHVHDDAGHGDAHAHGADHGLAHTMPLPLLFGVLGALLVLTIATVSVTSIDLGAQGNLVVAMIIATVKAALVCVFFMHLLWDKKFNAVLFLTSVLLLVLFLSLVTNDRGEYQHSVDEYRAQQLQQK